MRKSSLFLAVICVFLSPLSIACAGALAVDTSQAELIRLDQLGAMGLDGEALLKQVEGGKELLIYVAKGEILPADTMLDFPFVKSRDGKALLEFTQDTYLLISKKRFLISPDRQNWVGIHDGKSLKKLYGAKEGRLNLGFSSDKERGPTMTLSLEMH